MAKLRIRKYPHFDADFSLAEAEALVNDPDRVAQHAFFPFISYTERWTRFAKKGRVPDRKDRPIRFAARKDACIYSHYRELLVDLYEERLRQSSIANSVIAYRRIPKVSGVGNKSNIDFANDVFCAIEDIGDCLVYALDIKSFFENIDHAKLKQMWSDLLAVDKLPRDHYRVFRSVTKYASVDRESLYKALGFIGPKPLPLGGTRMGYLVDRVPLQVCKPKRFRKLVADAGLIKTNDFPYGIPQGSPISDVLANIYLLEFDAAVVATLTKCGGRYFRYSDDILIIVPGHTDDIPARLQGIRQALSKGGQNLLIQDKKSAVHRFDKAADGKVSCSLVYGSQGKNGLEYLGFRFDGARVYVRDSTRAGLNRKIVASSKRLALFYINTHPGLTLTQLQSSFNYNRVVMKFGRVMDFASNDNGYRRWTFWTYAVRARATFGKKGEPIMRQLNDYKSFVRRKVDEAFAACLARRRP